MDIEDAIPKKFRTPPKRIMQMLAFSLFLWVIGLGILIWRDAWIAVGIFICLWANNILRK